MSCFQPERSINRWHDCMPVLFFIGILLSALVVCCQRNEGSTWRRTWEKEEAKKVWTNASWEAVNDGWKSKYKSECPWVTVTCMKVDG